MEQVDTTLADCIAQFIADRETPAVYQLSGGMIAFMIDAIHRLGITPIINTRHEQAAGFAAEGGARVTGIPGFAFGTSGPGATNLLTPIASSFFDSVPVVYITGQVNQKEIRQNPNQRQNGFQELDICAMAEPITKKVFKPVNSQEVMDSLIDGWELTQSGRKGPVLIDIPINIQQEKMTYGRSFDKNKIFHEPTSADFAKIITSRLEKSKRPLILIGGGVRNADALELLDRFILKTKIPYVSSLMGLDALPKSRSLYLGFIGSYGNRWANTALLESDLLIVLGSRLDVRQTGNNIESFCKDKTIIRVDIDPHELTGRIKSDISLELDLQVFLKTMVKIEYVYESAEVVSNIKEIRERFPQEKEQPHDLVLNPSFVMRQLSSAFPNVGGFVVDVGQHQMWAAQSLSLSPGVRFLTSGGLGAMGFAIPASIGATIATRQKWVALVGDGCLQLSLSELQTIIHYNLPIAVCVFNNEQHGMVAQFQDENMNGRQIGTKVGYSNPDFTNLARTFGFERIYKVGNQIELQAFISTLQDWNSGPVFVEFCIDSKAKALPKLRVED